MNKTTYGPEVVDVYKELCQIKKQMNQWKLEDRKQPGSIGLDGRYLNIAYTDIENAINALADAMGRPEWSPSIDRYLSTTPS